MKLLYEPLEEKKEPKIDDFVLAEIAEQEEKPAGQRDGQLRLKELHDQEEEERRAWEQRRLERLQEQADEMLRKSVKRSKEILDEARKQSERIKKEAAEEGKKEGYELGWEEGKTQAYQEHQTALEAEREALKKRIASYVRQMDRARDKVMEEYLDDLKDISLAVAEKIMRISLKNSSQIVKRMILASTDKLKKTAWVKIYVGKDEAGMDLRGDRELLTELARISDNVKIVMMEEAEEGTCIIEMPNEIIDASAATQLENVKDILNNARL